MENVAEMPSSPPMLRTAVRRAAVWSITAYGGAQLLRFGGNLLLTRLLFPEAFGLMMLVNALLLGLQLFSDFGIGPSIVQSARGDDPRFLGTAFTLQALRGFALFAVACAAAVPFAAFYGEPALAWIVPVAGVSALVGGFNSMRLHTMHRRVELGRISLIELGSQAAAIAVMVAWAAVDRSIWALVAGAIGGSVAKLVLSHVALPGAPSRFAWDPAAFRQLAHFGRWILLSTLLTFLAAQSDRLLFGKLIPIGVLGVYGIGVMLAMLPATALGHVSSSVLFPVCSRLHNAGDDVRRVFFRMRGSLLVLAGWMIAGLGGGGAAAVAMLYDERYVEAGWVVQLLALGSWFAVLEITNGSALLARGLAQWTAAASAGKLAGMLVFIPLGYLAGGFPGAVLGLAATELFRYAVSAWGVSRLGLLDVSRDLRLTAWVLVTAALGAWVAGFATAQGWPPAAAAGFVFGAVTAAWIPAAFAALRAGSPLAVALTPESPPVPALGSAPRARPLPAPEPPRISVVILSWNTRDALASCLEALARDGDHELIVVDNASSDGSADMVARDWPRVRLMRNAENRLYAEGNNQGARAATGRFLCLLNSDTEARPGALESMARFLEREPGYAAVAPKLVNPDGTVQRACARLPNLLDPLIESTSLRSCPPGSWLWWWHCMGDFDHESSRDVDQPPGACFMMRREEFLAEGGLDPRLSLFFNDVDLCRELRRKGRRIRYLAEAEVMHHRGLSTGAFERKHRNLMWFKNRAAYYRKNYGRAGELWMRAVLGLWGLECGVRIRLGPRDASAKRAALDDLRRFLRQCSAAEGA